MRNITFSASKIRIFDGSRLTYPRAAVENSYDGIQFYN